MLVDELLPWLPTLVLLARTGSVSETARELGVPRSTVNRRLSRLEQVTGVKLADRTSHRVVLTAAGRTLVDGAVAAFSQLGSVCEEMLATEKEVRGSVRVAVQPGMSGAFVGWFLAFLHAQHPGIEVEQVATERLPTRMEDGFDMVLLMGTPEPSSWLRKKLSVAAIGAVAAPSYLSRRGTPERIEDLPNHVLLTSIASGQLSTWPRWKGTPISIAPHLRTNDLSTLRESVLAGVGIAMIPLHVVLAELSSGALVSVLPSVLGAQVDIFALYLPERKSSPVLKAVLGAAAEFAQTHSAT